MAAAAQRQVDKGEGDGEGEDQELKAGDAGLAGLFVEDGVDTNLVSDDGVQHGQTEREQQGRQLGAHQQHQGLLGQAAVEREISHDNDGRQADYDQHATNQVSPEHFHCIFPRFIPTAFNSGRGPRAAASAGLGCPARRDC